MQRRWKVWISSLQSKRGLIIASLLLIILWFCPFKSDLPSALSGKQVVLFVKSGCPTCDRIRPDYQALQTQYPGVHSSIVDVYEHPDWWQAIKLAGAPPSDNVPYLLVGNEAFTVPDDIQKEAPSIFLRAQQGKISSFHPVLSMHQRVLIAIAISAILYFLLQRMPSLPYKGAVAWLAACIAGIAIWQVWGQCAACGDRNNLHTTIALLGGAVYGFIALFERTSAARRLITLGSIAAGFLLALMLTGVAALCPPCILIDMLAMGIGLIRAPEAGAESQRVSRISKREVFSFVTLGLLILIINLVSQQSLHTLPLDTKIKPPQIGAYPPEILNVRDNGGNRLNLKSLQGRWTVLIWGKPDCEKCRQACDELKATPDVNLTPIWCSRRFSLPYPGWMSAPDHADADRFGARMDPTITILRPDGRIALTLDGKPMLPLSTVVAALRNEAPAYRLLTGYDEHFILIGNMPKDKGATSTYLPQLDARAWGRIEWLKKHYPDYHHVIWSNSTSINQLAFFGCEVKTPATERLSGLGLPPEKPHTFIVDKEGKVSYFEQAASPFPAEEVVETN